MCKSVLNERWYVGVGGTKGRVINMIKCAKLREL